MEARRTVPFFVIAALSLCAMRSSAADELKAYAGRYSMEIVGEDNRPLPTFDDHGRTYVMGEKGDRYRIRIHNRSGRRVEAVISVDGLDARDGKRSDWNKSGYLIAAHDSVTIDGFRLNLDAVATFRFSDVKGSYAAKTGDARDVGVIGVAVFPEYVYLPPPPVRQTYVPAPDYSRRSGLDDELSAPSASSLPQAKAGYGSGGPSDLASAQAEQASAPASGTKASVSAPKMAHRMADERPGLGTAFGEQRQSSVELVQFQRANPSRPGALMAIRYNDHDGLLALGINVDHPFCGDAHDLVRRETARPFANLPRFAAPPPGWDPYNP